MRLGWVLSRLCGFWILFLLLAPHAFAQQDYIGRFDAYAGYAYFNSPAIGLPEHGFGLQAGWRAKTWLTFGGDYSRATGDLILKPEVLTPALQQTLGAQLAALAAAGQLPAGYALAVKTGSITQTFAAGPQFSTHRWRHFSLFIRPAIGAVHDTAIPHPSDPIATAIVAQLTPSGKKQDWTGFYGFGGGADFILSKHFALRVQADFVHFHIFNDILQDSRNMLRFGVGPAVQWGKNIAK